VIATSLLAVLMSMFSGMFHANSAHALPTAVTRHPLSAHALPPSPNSAHALPG